MCVCLCAVGAVCAESECVCVCVCVCLCISMCIYIYIHIYTHTYDWFKTVVDAYDRAFRTESFPMLPCLASMSFIGAWTWEGFRKYGFGKVGACFFSFRSTPKS